MEPGPPPPQFCSRQLHRPPSPTALPLSPSEGGDSHRRTSADSSGQGWVREAALRQKARNEEDLLSSPTQTGRPLGSHLLQHVTSCRWCNTCCTGLGGGKQQKQRLSPSAGRPGAARDLASPNLQVRPQASAASRHPSAAHGSTRDLCLAFISYFPLLPFPINVYVSREQNSCPMFRWCPLPPQYWNRDGLVKR